MTHRSRTIRRGFMLIDLLMMLAVMGIVAVAIMPSTQPGEAMKLVAATTVVSADIEFAQSQTLSRPADPTIVRFDADGTRYWLALASSPDTPILRPNGIDPYEVVFGKGIYRELWGVTLDVQDLTDSTLEFDAMGRLVQSKDGVVRFGNGTGEVAVVVRATTGSVSIMDGSDVAKALEPAPEPPLADTEPDPAPIPQPDPSPPPTGGRKNGVFGIGILGL